MERPRLELAVENLDVRYGRSDALRSVSFDWSKGALGLTGANGSGKSTLIGAIVGSIAASSGDILFLRGDEALARRDVRVGHVPQSFDFPRGMRMLDFVSYAAWLQGLDDPTGRARAALREVGLDGVLTRKLGRASGGMVRRAGLAAALVGDPDLLVLDEPTTGVDPEQRSVIRSLLITQARRRAVMFSSHIAEDLEEVCDTVLVLANGEIAVAGSPAELRETTGTESIEAAIVAVARAGATMKRVGGP